MPHPDNALDSGLDSGAPERKRVMVVEDNDLNRKLFCDVLRAKGYAVEPLAEGGAVLARAREVRPDLIVMDIQLPQISGLDLIEALRADPALGPIPVLAVTAYAGRDDAERILGAGAQGCLAKPVSLGPFLGAVQQLI